MLSPIQPGQFELIQRHFADTNGAFDDHNAVLQETSDRMMSRLDLLAIEPTRVLDLGCRSGYQFDALQNRFPKAYVAGADPAPAARTMPNRWWRRRAVSPIVCCDPHRLPFADGSFDLVISNMLLPWCRNPDQVFAETARVLADNGAFMFTAAGPDTLQEYAELWRSVDSAQHVFGLADMHKTGDEMLHAGFAAPVLDRENIVVDYASVDALQDELRQIGACNVANGRRAGLMSHSVRMKLREAQSGDRFAVTLELVQGHGWKGGLTANRNNTSDEFSVSLDSLRQSLRGSGS